MRSCESDTACNCPAAAVQSERLKAPKALARGATASRAGPLARSMIFAKASASPANACARAPCTSAKAMPGEGNHWVAYWLSSHHSSGSRAWPAISARSRNEAETESVLIGGPVETPGRRWAR